MYNKEEIRWIIYGVKIGVFSGLLIGVGGGFYFTPSLINQAFGIIAVAVGVITLIGAFARVRGIKHEDLKGMQVKIEKLV